MTKEMITVHSRSDTEEELYSCQLAFHPFQQSQKNTSSRVKPAQGSTPVSATFWLWPWAGVRSPCTFILPYINCEYYFSVLFWRLQRFWAWKGAIQMLEPLFLSLMDVKNMQTEWRSRTTPTKTFVWDSEQNLLCKQDSHQQGFRPRTIDLGSPVISWKEQNYRVKELLPHQETA